MKYVFSDAEKISPSFKVTYNHQYVIKFIDGQIRKIIEIEQNC